MPHGVRHGCLPSRSPAAESDAAPSGSNTGAASNTAATPADKQPLRQILRSQQMLRQTTSAGDPKNAIWHAALPVDTSQSGFYEVQLNLAMPVGTTETHRFAYNVDPEEGNLKMVTGPDLESRRTGVKYHFHQVADSFFDADDPDQANFGPHDSVCAHCVAHRRATFGLRD